MSRLRTTVLVASVPLAALAALGGAYSSSVLPLLIAAALAFLVASPNVAARGTRVEDISLLVFLCGLGLQLAPIPEAVIDALSPNARAVAGLLLVGEDASTSTLSLRAAYTFETLSSAATVVLIYWTARGLLQTGGSRSVARLVSVVGVAVALAGLAQRATASRTLMWIWTPVTPTGRPMGPFVNRNHFAMWLVMAGALCAGALATHLAHRHATGKDRFRSDGVAQSLDDGTMLWLGGATALLWLTVIASGSRGGMLALAVFNAAWLALAGRRTMSRRTVAYAAAAVGFVALVGIWTNVETIAGRLGSGDAVSRTEVWRNTMPVIRDFWLTGTGGGTYASAMLLYQQTTRRLLFNEAQNEYLQLLAEGGLLLALPLLIWLAAWAATCARRIREDRSAMFWLRTGALAGLLAVASQCLWDAALRMPANALLAAILAAIVAHRKPTVPPAASPGRRRSPRDGDDLERAPDPALARPASA